MVSTVGHRSDSRQIGQDNCRALWQCAAVKLPNAEKAIVEREKVANYLLNAAHPDNGGKAAFFEELGFRRADPETLAKALQKSAHQAEVTRPQHRPMARNMLWLAKLNRRLGKPLTCKQFGLSIRAWTWLDWLRRIRTKHER